MQASVKIDALNRRATPELASLLESLAKFANIGVTSRDWQDFRLWSPDFFPTTGHGFKFPGHENMTEWLYQAPDFADEPLILAFAKPPIVWYRDHLRAVWSRNDHSGIHLAILLGFEKEAQEISKLHPEVQIDSIVRPISIPGQSLNPNQQNIGGLPPGSVKLNGRSASIEWEFSCDFQRAVYELTRSSWKAKICAICGKYFIAIKPATLYCSQKCTAEMKQKRHLEYWNEVGKPNRESRRKTKIRAAKRRSK